MHLCNLCRRHLEETFCKFGPMVQEEMPFKCISNVEPWQPFVLCYFGRGYYEEHFCEINLNLGQWFKRCCLEDFLSGTLAALLFGGVEPFMHF